MCAKAVSAEGLGTELRLIHRQVNQAAIDGMRTAAQRLRSDVVLEMGEVRPWAPIDTGTLRGAWATTNLPDGAAVENPTPYAAVMEYGARPFTPPLGPLREWAKRKMRGKTQPMPRGFQGPLRRLTQPLREELAERLALRTQWKISRYGIKGRGFWRATLKKAPKIVESSIDFHLRRVR